MRGTASLTARRTALYRAAHQIVENGSVFADPFAVPLLGEAPEAIAAAVAERPDDRLMRLFVVARSRYAEDHLAMAVARGLRQVVVLGAGLDTFGLRNPHAAQGLQVYEVDHPATQAWKRESLAQSGLRAPGSLHFVAIDFEHQSLMPRLAEAGFRRDEPAFFIWLGVVPYLTRAAIFATLDAIAELSDAELVFDYAEPVENASPEHRAWLVALIERLATLGEPWLSFFDPKNLAEDLRARGFTEIEDLKARELGKRYFCEALAAPEGRLGHILWARRSARVSAG